jgi:hypothetical protein
LAPKSRRRLFENDLAFLAPPVSFLKMTRLFEKADRLLVMSHENKIMGLTLFLLHSSGISGSFHHASNKTGALETCTRVKFLRKSETFYVHINRKWRF